MFKHFIKWQLDATGDFGPIYITSCGCHPCKDELKKNETKAFICIYHGGKVVNQISRCLNCTAKIKSRSRRSVCDDCKKIIHNRDARECVRLKKLGKVKPKEQRTKQPHTEPFSINRIGDYCRSVKTCFSEAGRDKKQMKCNVCQVYNPIFKGVDPKKMGYW